LIAQDDTLFACAIHQAKKIGTLLGHLRFSLQEGLQIYLVLNKRQTVISIAVTEVPKHATVHKIDYLS
jgi:hypothetical protein